MRRTRRIRDLADRKSLDDAYRSIHLRNIRINYSLNHEWEQLNWEIWVCVPHKLTFPRCDESAARRASARSSMAPARESISRKLRGKRRIPFSNFRERIPPLAESRARARKFGDARLLYYEIDEAEILRKAPPAKMVGPFRFGTPLVVLAFFNRNYNLIEPFSVWTARIWR